MDFEDVVGPTFAILLLILGIFAVYTFYAETAIKQEVCNDAGGEIPETSSSKCYINETLYDMIKLTSGWKVVGLEE